MHIEIFKQTQNKTIILLTVFLASLFESFGISLIYPFISILFELEHNNSFVLWIENFLEDLSLPRDQYFLAFYIIFLLLLKSTFLLFYRYLCAKSVLSYLIRIRSAIYKSIFKAKFGFAVDKVSQLTNGLTIQSELSASALQVQYNIIQAGFTFIALLILGLVLEFKVLLIAIAIGLIIYSLMMVSLRVAKNIGFNLAQLNEKYYKDINHGLKNYKYLKSTYSSNKIFNRIYPILSKINSA